MTPRQSALAYRLWAYAKPLGWACSLAEAAEALDCPRAELGTVAKAKGWSNRFRSTEPYFRDIKKHIILSRAFVTEIPIRSQAALD